MRKTSAKDEEMQTNAFIHSKKEKKNAESFDKVVNKTTTATNRMTLNSSDARIHHQRALEPHAPPWTNQMGPRL